MSAAHNLNQSERIRNLVPLNTLAKQQFEELLGKVSVQQLTPGEFLFRAGDVDQQNIYLLSGSVGLFSDDREVDRIDSRSDLARYPLAHQFPRKLSGRAASAVTILRMDNRLLSDSLSRSWTGNYQVEELDQPDLAGSDDWMTQLLGSRVLQLMPNANIPEVLRHVTRQELKAGEVVFNQGDAGTDYYFINRGRCGLTRVEEHGGETREVAQLGAGDSFGEDALLSGSPRSCTITMLTDGVLLRLSKKDFVELIKPPLCRYIAYGHAKGQVEAGAVWLDVRRAETRESGFLPGSIHLPFDLIRYQVSNLDIGRDYIVYCADGCSSTAAAYLLTERGFRVAVLNRGLAAVPAEDLVTEDLKPGGHLRLALKNPHLAEQTPKQDRRSSDTEELDRALDRAGRLERALAHAQARVAELEMAQVGQEALEQAQARIVELERRQSQLDELEYAHEQEVVMLKGALAGAQDRLAELSSAAIQGREHEVLKLREALKTAVGNVHELTQQNEQMEQRHLRETEELQGLWEKRVRALEAQLREQQERLRRAALEPASGQPVSPTSANTYGH